tara:strand:+ start:1061 stop:1357 length:297 start_codon:yes stop_codon:yes gene_type:complete
MPEENDDLQPELTESERIHMEQIMVEKAFENSYKVITKRKTFEELIDTKTSIGTRAILIYDPSEGYDEFTLEDMIDYFEEDEEYEKCAELKKILDNYV